MIKITTNAQYQISLKLIIKNRRGEVLIMKADSNGSMPGYYDLPGGRIQEHERELSFKTLILRELSEELGPSLKIKLREVPVAIGRHTYKRKDGTTQYLMWILFEADYVGGQVVSSSEHEGYRWVKITKRNLTKYFIKGPLEAMRNYLYKKLG